MEGFGGTVIVEFTRRCTHWESGDHGAGTVAGTAAAGWLAAVAFAALDVGGGGGEGVVERPGGGVAGEEGKVEKDE